jgi:hypothetical protein
MMALNVTLVVVLHETLENEFGLTAIITPVACGGIGVSAAVGEGVRDGTTVAKVVSVGVGV